jgi:RNA polymerase sigma factor (TIGR02999 family)
MGDITELLARARDGDRGSLDAVFARLYPELKQLARRRGAGPDATLSATALVNEAWLKLTSGSVPQLADRQHFLACAARAMRLIVVDEARRVHAAKRGYGPPVAGLDPGLLAADFDNDQLLAIDQALDALDAIDPAQRELVELHWFAGLDFVEIAALRDVNERTVRRGWQRARAFLAAQLSGDDGA